jgi:hypothetical protein
MLYQLSYASYGLVRHVCANPSMIRPASRDKH